MHRHMGTPLCPTQFLENHIFLGFFLAWRVLSCMLFFSLIIDYFFFIWLKFTKLNELELIFKKIIFIGFKSLISSFVSFTTIF
jgi:hypothetical protein